MQVYCLFSGVNEEPSGPNGRPGHRTFEESAMKRRQILKAIAVIHTAGILKSQQPVVPPKPTPAAEGIPKVESSSPDVAATTVQRFFSAPQFEALQRLSDTVAPAIGDVPGALAAGAPEFLDFLIGESPADRQALYRGGLNELNWRAKQKFHVFFGQTNVPEADAILSPLRKPWEPEASDLFTLFLRTAKEDILQATHNSREWIDVMSKRVRSAGGLGTYWYRID
jgi:hypothetical protein